MDAKQISELLFGENSKKFQETTEALIKIPDSFVAISWSSYYDYLFISENVEKLLGYSYQNFTKNGIVFLQSITPPGVIQKVFTQLEEQLINLKKKKFFYEKKNILTADGALRASNGQLKEIKFIGTILDFRIAEPESLLIACIYLDREKVEREQKYQLFAEIETLLHKLKKIYVEKKTKHFDFLNLIPDLLAERKKY